MAASLQSSTSPPAPLILTNGDVKRALLNYNLYQEQILDRALGKDQLTDKTRLYGFANLTRVERVRSAIDAIVRQKSVGSTDPNGGTLDKFRRQLVYVVAASARKDSLFLVLFLYCALMERHAASATEAAYLIDDNPTAAGEYLLLCLSVQAAYSDFASYLLILDRFGRLIEALKHELSFNCADLTSFLAAASAAALGADPAWPSTPATRVKKEALVFPVQLVPFKDETDDARRVLAKALRTQLEPKPDAKSPPVVVVFLDFEFPEQEKQRSVANYFTDALADSQVLSVILRRSAERKGPNWIATKTSVTLVLQEALLSKFVKFFVGDGGALPDAGKAAFISRKVLEDKEAGQTKVPESKLFEAIGKIDETTEGVDSRIDEEGPASTVKAVRRALEYFVGIPPTKEGSP
jgi:hypothetical protein